MAVIRSGAPEGGGENACGARKSQRRMAKASAVPLGRLPRELVPEGCRRGLFGEHSTAILGRGELDDRRGSGSRFDVDGDTAPVDGRTEAATVSDAEPLIGLEPVRARRNLGEHPVAHPALKDDDPAAPGHPYVPTDPSNWARNEGLLRGQRTRRLDEVYVRMRNRVAHPSSYGLVTPVDRPGRRPRLGAVRRLRRGASTPRLGGVSVERSRSFGPLCSSAAERYRFAVETYSNEMESTPVTCETDETSVYTTVQLSGTRETA